VRKTLTLLAIYNSWAVSRNESPIYNDAEEFFKVLKKLELNGAPYH